jgi:hypothetical protein
MRITTTTTLLAVLVVAVLFGVCVVHRDNCLSARGTGCTFLPWSGKYSKKVPVLVTPSNFNDFGGCQGGTFGGC